MALKWSVVKTVFVPILLKWIEMVHLHREMIHFQLNKRENEIFEQSHSIKNEIKLISHMTETVYAWKDAWR